MFEEPLDSMRVITFEEQAAYLSKAGQPLRDIAEIMLDTGMRPEEVFRIRVENVDLKQKAIFNPFGKTKAARRTIPMTEDILLLLKNRMKKATEVPDTKRTTGARHYPDDDAIRSSCRGAKMVGDSEV